MIRTCGSYFIDFTLRHATRKSLNNLEVDTTFSKVLNQMVSSQPAILLTHCTYQIQYR